MSERADRIAAALTLASEPGAGTEIVAVWPND
jgi:signal transduction histidine kinase